MTATKYPQYRLTQWLDTSEDAMEQQFGTILYGVETKRVKGGAWMKCATSDGPLLLKTREDGSEWIKAMKARDAK